MLGPRQQPCFFSLFLPSTLLAVAYSARGRRTTSRFLLMERLRTKDLSDSFLFSRSVVGVHYNLSYWKRMNQLGRLSPSFFVFFTRLFERTGESLEMLGSACE
jgi:hypothetical protein